MIMQDQKLLFKMERKYRISQTISDIIKESSVDCLQTTRDDVNIHHNCLQFDKKLQDETSYFPGMTADKLSMVDKKQLEAKFSYFMKPNIYIVSALQEGRDELTGQLNGMFNPLFWVYFPETRNILINSEVFNLVKNDAERRTYDDIFWKRMFASTIVKQSNVYDRKIPEYMVGLDALLEAENIKAEIFNIEHDLWEY